MKKDSYEWGKQILDRGEWFAPRFGTASLSEPIDWFQNPFSNRSWVWLLHQFSFFRDLFAVDDEEGGTRGMEFALRTVQSWWAQFPDYDAAPKDIWHDHGSAFRALNLIQLYRRLEDLGTRQDDLVYLQGLIDVHATYLSLEEKYSRNSNHGLDQSLVLFQLAKEFPQSSWSQSHAATARQRLVFEVDNAFAPDGGHLENSVHYQVVGIVQLLEILAVEQSYCAPEDGIIPDLKERIDLALKRLCFMVSPLGNFTLIGDTEANMRPDPFARTTWVPDHLPNWQFVRSKGRLGEPPAKPDMMLKETGWIVMRDTWSGPEDIHLISKCGYNKQYHRHDDDTAIILHGFGTEWITDGGLYAYQERDPLRLLLRSHKGHSLSYPDGVTPVRRLAESEVRSCVKQRYSGAYRAHVTLESHMFPEFVSVRKIFFDRRKKLLELHDVITPTSSEGEARPYVTQFLIPGDKEVEVIEDQRVSIRSETHRLEITCSVPPSSIDVVKGQEEPELRGWRSPRFGVKEDVHSLCFHHHAPTLDCSYSLQFMV
ncbi:heparinase II/III family protein [Falsiruegeria mediterranea]|uniref:Uncharacterized protein n=1 Tax=Falsiruegeria mediterranea M17 TaxID=1200281 RepID=A0A2R8CGU2_9RHOB|nr:heparinase II/III family protein [Falsiruegeria mediterranea]SPJ31508.1 hypothetical protein TRM7615_05051 [Falsiruegeria mediterranea M17]